MGLKAISAVKTRCLMLVSFLPAIQFSFLRCFNTSVCVFARLFFCDVLFIFYIAVVLFVMLYRDLLIEG